LRVRQRLAILMLSPFLLFTFPLFAAPTSAPESEISRSAGAPADDERPLHLTRMLGHDGAGPMVGDAFSNADWRSLSVWLQLSEDQQAAWDDRHALLVANWNRRARAARDELSEGSKLMLQSYSMQAVSQDTLDRIEQYHRTVWSLADQHEDDLEVAILSFESLLDPSQAARLPKVQSLAQRVHELRWMSRPIPGARVDVEWVLTLRLPDCEGGADSTLDSVDTALEYYRAVAGEVIRRVASESRKAALDSLTASANYRSAQQDVADRDEIARLRSAMLEAVSRPRHLQIPFRSLCTGTMGQVASMLNKNCATGLMEDWDMEAFFPVAEVRLESTPQLRESLDATCEALGMPDALAAHRADCKAKTDALEARYEAWLKEAHVTGVRHSDSVKAYVSDMRALRSSLWRTRLDFLRSMESLAREKQIAIPSVLAEHQTEVDNRWVEYENEPTDHPGSWPNYTR
jgi:hypothetical protein